ncbi:hypothetical protein ACQ4LE_009155 [Meloidogyne hapla]
MHFLKIIFIPPFILILLFLPASNGGCMTSKHKATPEGSPPSNVVQNNAIHCVHELEFDLNNIRQINSISTEEGTLNIAVNYAEEYEIGSGGFAKVYHAYWIERRKCVALKVSILQNDRRRKVAENDLEVLKHFSLNENANSHIIKIFGLTKLEIENTLHSIYSVLELGGETLHSYFHKLKIEHGDNTILIAKILKGAALAIKELHDKNFIHMDIKADNFVIVYENDQMEIMTSPVIKAKLIDFNSTVIPTKEIELFQVKAMNSLLMAPELDKETTENVSKSVDIWSFGLMAYELRYGLHYGPKEQPKLLRKLKKYRSVNQHDTPLDNLIKSCIKLKPKDRTNIDEILDFLEHILN